MASRILAPSLRPLLRPIKPLRTSQTFFHSSSRLQQAAVAATAIPVRKPVGAFRGGCAIFPNSPIEIQLTSSLLKPPRIFGFLLGSTLAGAGTYYYILEEYKVSNELLTEDIYVSRRDSVDELYERVAI